MNIDIIQKFLIDYREVIEIILIIIFAFSSTIRGVIAQVSEMLQSASTTDPEVAMNKAVKLLQKKIPLPAFLLKAIIQWFFDSMKAASNKEIAEIKAWTPEKM